MAGAVYVFSNNASSTLAVAATTSSTALTLAAGTGAKFPETPSTTFGPSWFFVTLVGNTGVHEIVLCTARTGDVLTVSRARQTTTAQAWPVGTRVEQRLTATVLGNWVQKSGAVMTGTLDMGGNAIRNPTFPNGLGTDVLTAHELRHEVDTVNRWGFELHTNRLPDVNGDPILTKSQLVGMIFMWSGSLASLNTTVWKLCDGTNGTPDLRDRFILGAGNLFSPGQKYPGTVSALTQPTSEDGYHDHQGSTGGTALTVAQMPAHTHNVPSGGAAPNQSGGYASFGDNKATAPQTTSSVGSGASHNHSIPMGGKHTHTIQPPAFYTLAYVMLR